MENFLLLLKGFFMTFGVIFLVRVCSNPKLKKKYFREYSIKGAILIILVCIAIAVLIAWILADLLVKGYLPAK